MRDDPRQDETVSQQYPLDSEDVWCELLAPPLRERPALFLDRDGVVIEDTGYLCRAEDIVVIPGAARVVAAANAQDTPVVLVTNQSGIGRGLYGWPEFAAVQQALIAQLAAAGARLDAVYAVPFHPQGVGRFAHQDHPARKPNPGMLLRARDAFGIDLARSWMVGDRVADVVAAQRAGLAGALHVLTGHGREERDMLPAATPPFELRFGRSIADAADLPIVKPR